MNKPLENEVNVDNTGKAPWTQPTVSLLATEATEGKDTFFSSEYSAGAKFTGPS